ncbi:17459_t:CDS:2, partial [Dentiscutata erythropus]
SQKVVLKSLNNSNENMEKFFEEAKRFIQIRSGDIVNAYGITKIKTSENDNFAIVMNYFADGNLRDYIKKNHSTLTLQDRVFAIWQLNKSSDINGVRSKNSESHTSASNMSIKDAAVRIEPFLQDTILLA